MSVENLCSLIPLWKKVSFMSRPNFSKEENNLNSVGTKAIQNRKFYVPFSFAGIETGLEPLSLNTTTVESRDFLNAVKGKPKLIRKHKSTFKCGSFRNSPNLFVKQKLGTTFIQSYCKWIGQYRRENDTEASLDYFRGGC